MRIVALPLLHRILRRFYFLRELSSIANVEFDSTSPPCVAFCSHLPSDKFLESWKLEYVHDRGIRVDEARMRLFFLPRSAIG